MKSMLPGQPLERLPDLVERLRLEGVVGGHVHVPHRPPLDDDLAPHVGVRLQENRVHVGVGRDAAGRRLHRLGPADLPPSGVTAELSAMFWDLKGATRRPRFLRIRQIPAVMTDFPTSDPVPQIMTARDAPGTGDWGLGAGRYRTLGFGRSTLGL